MYGGEDDFFEDVFDFDGDGKTSFDEALIAHDLFLSDEELKLEYGETDDDAYSLDDSDEADYNDTSYSMPIGISVEFGSDDSQDTVKRSDYPNERTYQAAGFLEYAERNSDIDYSKDIEKCRFILNNPNITAAKYLNYQYGFLFAQAIKDRFKLPISIPDDDGKIHTTFSELFRKIARYNVEFAIRVWHWTLTMFSPYIQFGDNNDADMLTSFIMCDIEEKQLITAAIYAEAHPRFAVDFLNTMPKIPCKTDEWICLCIKNNSVNTAKVLFEGCLSSKKIECDVKERFVTSVLENACNYDETDTAIFFRDVLLPTVPKYADKPMKRKMSEWQSDISEYIKDSTEEADDEAYESETECHKMYQEIQEAEHRKQKEQRDAELNHRMAVYREIESGTEVKQYIYCAVILSSVSRHYHYRTTDESIRIGDKVIVPVGDDNRQIVSIKIALP